QGQDLVPRVDEPRAPHPPQRDPRVRRSVAHVVEGAAVVARARIARAHQAQRRAPARSHQRRARPREGRGRARRGAARARQRGAAPPRPRPRGREPAIGQEPSPGSRRWRGLCRHHDRPAARAADHHQPPRQRHQVHRRGRDHDQRARDRQRGAGRRARHGHRHPRPRDEGALPGLSSARGGRRPSLRRDWRGARARPRRRDRGALAAGRRLDVHARLAEDSSASAGAGGRDRRSPRARVDPPREGPFVTGAPAGTATLATLATLGDASGNVLIVDDFPDTLALYEAVLSEDGHNVRLASNGLEALRKVDELEPEVVLLDVSMPGLDGVEVLKRLRTRRGGGPAVIMLTAARREPHAIEAGLKEGADAYLTKPIDSRELVARVRAALETFRLKRVLEAQRRDHIAMLVHDLRHPLSSLGLIAEVLESEDMSAAEFQATVSQIRTMCADMSRLVDGVLVASRLEAGVFTVEARTIPARAIIGPMLAVFSPVATRRRVALSLEGSLDLEVHADPQKLRQALDNVLANALKFTPRGGRVRVRVGREPGPPALT